MADDSELDYIRSLLFVLTRYSSVKHYSEVRKIDSINDTRRILIYPPELINVDGKFYTKRYKVQLSEDSEANLMNTFNKIVNGFNEFNRGTYNQDFRGTYSFTDETVGTSGTDIDWVTAGFEAAHCSIISDWILHNKVLKFYDDDGFSSANHNWETPHYTDNTVEFWIAVDDATPEQVFAFYDETDNCFFLKILNDKMYASDTEVKNINDNTWYHIKFIWVIGNTFDLYIDNVLEADDQSMATNMTNGIDNLFINSNANDNNKFIYLDAIGYGWDTDYTIGDNYPAYSRPAVLVYIDLKYSNIAYENGKTKRWYQDIYLDVEWSTE